MNRIEERFTLLERENRKAIITYITAGYPSLEKTISIVKAQAEAGVDVIELGIPFSDPTADGPVIQAASCRAIENGVTLEKVFDVMTVLRKECDIPVVFIMYFNTALHYGLERFVKRCMQTGVDGIIIPDLPYEEQEQLQKYLTQENAPVLIQSVAYSSGERMNKVLSNAKGFVNCLLPVQKVTDDMLSNNVAEYIDAVKSVTNLPLVAGFNGEQLSDIKDFGRYFDGVVLDSLFISMMEEKQFVETSISEYIRECRELI